MNDDPQALRQLSRPALIERARRLGVPGADSMTRDELADELIRRSVVDPTTRRKARGWFGVARDLVAGLVENGLNLPETAALIRGEPLPLPEPRPRPPLPTATLAGIFSAQGHAESAKEILREVLERAPADPAARQLLKRLEPEAPSAAKPSQDAVSLQREPPDAALLAWELCEDTVRSLRSAEGEVALLAVLLLAVPFADGVRTALRIVPVEDTHGQHVFGHIPRGAELRAMLAQRRRTGRLEPVAVANLVHTDTLSVAWKPRDGAKLVASSLRG